MFFLHIDIYSSLQYNWILITPVLTETLTEDVPNHSDTKVQNCILGDKLITCFLEIHKMF